MNAQPPPQSSGQSSGQSSAAPVATVSTRPATFDVVGIGNAIVDVIAQTDDEFLDRFELVKGSMSLIDTDRAVELYRALGSAVEMSGGSAANTMCGIASFGGRAAYLGKVSDDDLGAVFGHDMRAVGVRFVPGKLDNDLPTGRSIVIVTPDAERTMNTYLGSASMFGVDDLVEETIASSRVLYMEGYLYDREPAKAAFKAAADIAHQAGRQVSLSLSDSFCVARHREDFLDLVSDRVDIVFGNQAELTSLYETDDLDSAIASAAVNCSVVVATVGAGGSRVAAGGAMVDVPAVGVPTLVDTTGAGDLYAAGFLFGYASGRDFAACGRLGSIAAAEVIGHIGPRPLVELRTLI